MIIILDNIVKTKLLIIKRNKMSGIISGVKSETADNKKIETTYKAATSATKGVKKSIEEQKLLQKQKQAAYNKTLTKSTSVDPHTGATYTTLTDPYGKVKNVSSTISTNKGTRTVHLNPAQQKMLQRNIESGKKNEQRRAAYKKQEELHGKDSKQYKAVTKAAPISRYETVVPGFSPSSPF